MKEKWEEFKATLTDIVMMSKKEFLLTTAVCVLGGIVFGMLVSPRKSTTIGSNNGNNSGNGNRGNGIGDKKDGDKTDKGQDKIADWQEVEEKELENA